MLKIDLLDSEWLDELKRIDQEAFDYWYPNIHLPQDVGTAGIVGGRDDDKPCILRIDAKSA